MVSQHALQVVSHHALQVSRRSVSQHALQVSRPTPKREAEGSGWGGLQAHTQGGLQDHTQGVSRATPGGSPGPHPGDVSQHALRQTPPMVTAVGGTHPTGMHSCF